VSEEVLETPAKRSSVSVQERRTQFAYLLSGAAIIGVVFFYLQYSTKAICCGDFDGYYHFKWARLLWESFRTGHFLPTFNALPLTTLNPRDYVDHHFLFHVLQIPFTWISSDQHTSAKISAWFFATLGVFSCYWLVVRYRLRYTLLWLLALLSCSNAFLFRMNMTKAMSFSLALLALGIVLIFERKYKWLALLSFIFVWTYSMWVLLPVAVVMWAGIILWSERRLEWQPVVWCAAGCIAGLIINPYFPKYIVLFYEHAMMKLSPSGFPTSTGQEWYPWDTRQFIAQCLVASVAMLVGYIAFNWRNRRQAQRPLFFLLFSTLLMLMTAYSKRYNEFFPPFAVLFAAFTLQPLIAAPDDDVASLPPDVLDELQPYLDRDAPPVDEPVNADKRWQDDEATVFGFTLAVVASVVLVRLTLSTPIEYAIVAALIAAGGIGYYFLRRNRALVAFFIAIGLGFTLFFNARHTAADIADTGTDYPFRSSPERFRSAMDWIKANVPKGELIFNTNWDHFPKLFFESSDYAYVSGLDPNYLLDENRELAEIYDRIRTGNEEDAALLIRDKFGARYIITDQKKRGEDFFFNIMRSGWVEEVYDDDFATILRIRDAKGTVPAEYLDDNEQQQQETQNETQANQDEPVNENEMMNDDGEEEDSGDSVLDPEPSPNGNNGTPN
jgi:hypothetical protein